MSVKRISEEQINAFLNGRDPQEKIISIECGYQDDKASIIYKDEFDRKMLKKQDMYPFVWAKTTGAHKLFIGKETGYQDRKLLKNKLKQYHIKVKGLNIYSEDGKTTERLANGYNLIFMAEKPMSYSKLLFFFKEAGVDIFDDSKDFLQVSPVEQFMIKTGKRMFKGYDDYDDLLRMEFDLETQGLNPEYSAIDQIGIRTNKGYEQIITVEGDELKAIEQLFIIIKEIKPDVITGHNSENFDWNFIIKRCEVLGSSAEEISKKYLKIPLYKKKRKTVLKLGGETEYFNQTIVWGHNVTDSLHAVRRAQAIDSNMKLANLKYVTKYSKLTKQNRVYVDGDKIKNIWNDTVNNYAFNDLDGSWYVISDENPLKDNYEIVDGRYIIQRYLLDDLYETDKVEVRYNQPNFLLGKLLPTTFTRVCTMGTAGIWKLIMMAWSFENNLAIPDFSKAGKFTGGLSRLLRVGFVDNVVKLDYNSLYPSITLTWGIKPEHDISNVMLSLLGYVLEKREEYKDLKGEAKGKSKKSKEKLEEYLKLAIKDENEIEKIKKDVKHWESEEKINDNKQSPLKLTGNSFFGSFGAPNLFPWGDLNCAEKITCIGRQSLRLMIKWFSDKGYNPVVGDSFLFDTPIYIKYKDSGVIDIKTISDVFDEKESRIDELGREYDLSDKPYYVLCRGGWIDPTYVYRHKTDKQIHRVEFKDGFIDVTADHSLFNEEKQEIHSKMVIPNQTRLEMAEIQYNDIVDRKVIFEDKFIIELANDLAININNKSNIPTTILNCTKENQKLFLNHFMLTIKSNNIKISENNKLLKAGILFLMNRVK